MKDFKQPVDDFDKDKIDEKELQKYTKDYSEQGFKNKIAKYAKVIGANVLYKAIQLWYVMQKPDVPTKQKALIAGAIGYLIAPLDFLPDLAPILGYSDDLVAITWTLVQVQGYIDEEVKEKSKHALEGLFSVEVVSELD